MTLSNVFDQRQRFTFLLNCRVHFRNEMLHILIFILTTAKSLSLRCDYGLRPTRRCSYYKYFSIKIFSHTRYGREMKSLYLVSINIFSPVTDFFSEGAWHPVIHRNFFQTASGRKVEVFSVSDHSGLSATRADNTCPDSILKPYGQYGAVRITGGPVSNGLNCL